MPYISPVLRITIGLLLLTISLLLIGDLLGIVPNQKQSEIDARKITSESLAIQISSEISENRIDQAIALLDIFVKRNKHIQSIGLRAKSKEMIMQSKNHAQYWTNTEDDRSSATHIQVPIYGNKTRWGTLEVTFVPLGSFWSDLFQNRSFPAMLLFIFIFGFITYWLFLKRVLSELDPSSIVPGRVRSALDVLTEGLVILDTSERIILVNDSLKKKLGLSESELIGKRLSNLGWHTDNNDTPVENKNLPWNILLETNEVPKSSPLKLQTLNHGTLTVDINVAPIKTPKQNLKGVIVTIDDVTELEKKNTDLNHILNRLEKTQAEISRQNLELLEIATRDSLTNLLNRRSLYEGLNNLLSEAYSQTNVLSCIMVDIDFFKSVNDNLGHAAGDTVIQVFAEILQQSVHSDDLVGRYGGEEFVIVLPGINELEASKVSEKMRLIISQRSFDELSPDLTITASFGVTSTESNVWQADKLIDQADQALYFAKHSGRNRVVCYSQKNMNQSNVTTAASQNTKETITEDKSSLSDISNNVTQISKHREISQNDFNIIGQSSRTVIMDRLTQAQKSAQRNMTSLAVLTIFIDTIQFTNNTFGHASAEKLKNIAFARLKDTFRLSDSVIPEVNSTQSLSLSRSSDSEFVAILSGIEDSADTTWAIYRTFKALAIPTEIDGNEIVMTANIGISIYPTDGKHPDELLTNSKMALQKANEAGRGTFLFYNEEMNDLAKKTLKIESQLHQAIEKEELYLNYQPIVNTKTGKVEKLEALLRWKHPELGLVSPDTFINISEHTGIIKIIGIWVMQKACRQLKVWQTQGYPDLMMSINLSAVQFNQINLVEEIMNVVEEEEVSPKSIVLELTETVLLKPFDYIKKIIFQLHDAGFQIALDDFGTGYSSLDHLRGFPISLVKIDRSFMTDAPHDIRAVSLLGGLISLCHNLNINIITEGVEDESQLLMLRDLGSDEVQGYLISRPLSDVDTTKFMASTSSRRMIKKLNAPQKEVINKQNGTSLTEILNTPPS